MLMLPYLLQDEEASDILRRFVNERLIVLTVSMMEMAKK